MKTLILLLTLIAPLAANAKTYHLTPDTAPFLIDALLRAGVKANTTRSLYTISVDDLSCSYREIEEDVKDPRYGLWDYGCNIPNVSEGSAKELYEINERIKYQESDYPEIGDCGMGKCVLDIKAVRCSIDSGQEIHDKRFACTIDDGVN